MKKTALITGVTGMDGSHLSDLLLEKDYKVYGLVRRTSTPNTSRIDHLKDHPSFSLVEGDITDLSSLQRLISQIKPNELYHLAAQSHVFTSFNEPVHTAQVTGLGTLNVLEAIRASGRWIKMYNAATSELFGGVSNNACNEQTPFYPKSPYGVAKLYGYWITKNYREAYGMFACSGILFNHDCVSANSPILVKAKGIVNVCSIQDLVPLRRKGPSKQQWDSQGLEVWDGKQWTKIKTISATKRSKKQFNHEMITTHTRAGVTETTRHHKMLKQDYSSISATDLKVNDLLALAEGLPLPESFSTITKEMARFLGLMTAEGYIAKDGRNKRFTNTDLNLIHEVKTLWSKLTLGETSTYVGVSGFKSAKEIINLNLLGSSDLGLWLRNQIYREDGLKQVPLLILNANKETQKEFLEGYYAGDGLKSTGSISFVSNSPFLTQGIIWLYSNLNSPNFSVYQEEREKGLVYYRVNIQKESNKGKHLIKNSHEIRKITPTLVPSEWVFDLETESEHFMTGVGKVVVHNSPRRGLEFVTRKITSTLARIKQGKATHIKLGNLAPRRDITSARDMVRGMHLILQQSDPEDFVLGSGIAPTMQEIFEHACKFFELDPQAVLKIDPSLYRPAEVQCLIADYSKAKEKLGWEPTITWQELIESMCKSEET